MKKSAFLLSIFLSISLFACTANEHKEETTKETKESNVIHLNDQSFKELIYDYSSNQEWNYKGERPAVIDFYATWCGPCKKLAPIYDKLSIEYKGKVDLYKVDVDKAKQLSALFKIKSIPTLLYIPIKGEPILIPGSLSEEGLKEKIDQLLK